jgi:hypothetical protein
MVASPGLKKRENTMTREKENRVFHIISETHCRQKIKDHL